MDDNDHSAEEERTTGKLKQFTCTAPYKVSIILVFRPSLSSSSVRTLRCGYTSAPWKRLFESA